LDLEGVFFCIHAIILLRPEVHLDWLCEWDPKGEAKKSGLVESVLFSASQAYEFLLPLQTEFPLKLFFMPRMLHAKVNCLNFHFDHALLL